MDTRDTRDTQEWQGLSVRDREGRTLGIVVGTFTEGLLAGRLRVHGDYAPAPGRYAAGPQAGTAVFAIPRPGVLRRDQDGLVVARTAHYARSKWLMHVLEQ